MISRMWTRWSVRFGCLALGLAAPLGAAEPASAPGDKLPAAAAPSQEAEPAKFVRIQRDAAAQPLALQTAITSFQGSRPDQAGLSVDLIGAVHIGDKSYYEQLNETFAKYEVVLYELVAPPGTRIPKGGRSGNHPVNGLQTGMGNMLGLEHQLQWVDYTKENLVHADMSPDMLAKSMKDRGESLWKMVFRAIGHSMGKQSEGGKSSTGDLDIMKALFASKQEGSLKRVLAEQFEDLDSMTAALEGPEGSTLLSERNKVALAELSRQIAAGKRRIAIFYGCAHLPDMQRRLVADFALKASGQKWLSAWDLTDKKK